MLMERVTSCMGHSPTRLLSNILEVLLSFMCRVQSWAQGALVSVDAFILMY